ncbi:MAG: VWA domain-containing protein [Clostridiaceae bacterium]|nr:VWA domain-containing protein [Clostridiaceae bacterium]
MILRYPWGLLALLAIPVIIVLYLLKQKNEEHVISSLYLWQNALQDIEVSTPWQKLKKNLLMFLQVFAVALLALVLSEPFLKTGRQLDKDVMIVIDCSLSMQASDIKPSRFEAAKEDAVKLVESCGVNMNFTLIASGNTPHVLLHQVNDKDKVILEIKNLQADDTAEDIEGTIELVNSLLYDNPAIQVNWFGDGTGANEINSRIDVFDGHGGNDGGFQGINYYSYNGQGANYAITLLSYRKRQDSGEITALSRIGNFSPRDAENDVSLYVDGDFFDAKRVTVKAGESENLYWTGIPGLAANLQCRIDTADMLEKDNEAGAIVFAGSIRKVLLVTERNIYLEKVLKLMPDLEVYRTTPVAAGGLSFKDWRRTGKMSLENSEENTEGFDGNYDLYIFDGVLPEELPPDGHIIVFNPPENRLFSISGRSEYTEIFATGHELFEGLKGDISFGAMQTYLYELPRWGNPVMKNSEGIAAFEGYVGKNRIMVFGFDLHETNLPVQPYFPVIIARAVQELLPGQGGIKEVSSVYAGDAVELAINPGAEEVFVVRPDGNRELIAPPFPATRYDGTSHIGVYVLEQRLENGTIRQEFIVNAPSEREFAFAYAGPGSGKQVTDNMDSKDEIDYENGMSNLNNNETETGETAKGETATGETAKGETAAGETAEGGKAAGETAPGKTAAEQPWNTFSALLDLKMLLLWILLAILVLEWWVYAYGIAV